MLGCPCQDCAETRKYLESIEGVCVDCLTTTPPDVLKLTATELKTRLAAMEKDGRLISTIPVIEQIDRGIIATAVVSVLTEIRRREKIAEEKGMYKAPPIPPKLSLKDLLADALGIPVAQIHEFKATPAATATTDSVKSTDVGQTIDTNPIAAIGREIKALETQVAQTRATAGSAIDSVEARLGVLRRRHDALVQDMKVKN